LRFERPPWHRQWSSRSAVERPGLPPLPWTCWRGPWCARSGSHGVCPCKKTIKNAEYEDLPRIYWWITHMPKFNQMTSKTQNVKFGIQLRPPAARNKWCYFWTPISVELMGVACVTCFMNINFLCCGPKNGPDLHAVNSRRFLPLGIQHMLCTQGEASSYVYSMLWKYRRSFVDRKMALLGSTACCERKESSSLANTSCCVPNVSPLLASTACCGNMSVQIKISLTIRIQRLPPNPLFRREQSSVSQHMA
jgi:hypothetical protein